MSTSSKKYQRALSTLLFILFCWAILPTSVQADCLASPVLFVGESAGYRFTNENAEVIDVSIKVTSEEKYWYVLDVTEGTEEYRVTVETGCFDTGLPPDYQPPAEPSYFTYSRLVTILLPDAYPFSANRSENNQGYNLYQCSQEERNFGAPLSRSLRVNKCNVASSTGAMFEGVLSVDSTFAAQNTNAPLSGLISKTLNLNNEQSRTVELISIGDEYIDDGSPRPVISLMGLSYSSSALELVWERPSDNRAVLFEVRRDNELLDLIDGLSYYDGNLVPQQFHEYSITAIDVDGNRSATVNIVPTLYNYGFIGDQTPPTVTVSPPQNLLARIYSGTAAELFFWQPPYPVISGTSFEITRNGRVVTILNGTSFFDDTLEPGSRYEYGVTALSPASARSQTNFTSVNTPQSPGAAAAPINKPDINAPTINTAAEVYSTSAAELFWDSPGGIGQRFEIYRDGELVAQTDGSSYFTNNLSSGTTYEFVVHSYDYEGALDSVSDVVTLTTQGERDESQDKENNGFQNFVTSPGKKEIETDLLRIGDWTRLGNELFYPARYQIFRDQKNLNEFHAALYNCDCEVEALPEIDFTESAVMFVAHPFSGGGSPTTTIESVTLQGNLLTVDVLNSEAGNGCPVDAAISGEFRYYAVKSLAPEVNFAARTVFGESCN